MKRLASFVLVLAAILWIAPAAIVAQTPYSVKEGDTLYVLKGIYSPTQAEWRGLTIANPQLAERGRSFVDKQNRFIVILRPGEMIYGLDQLGVTVEPLPLSDLAMPAVSAAAPNAEAAVEQAQETGFNWFPWLIAIAAITILAIVMRYRRWRESELRRDPITSGIPYVQGGIPATDTPRLTNFFDQQAINRYAERYPAVERSTIRATRVGPIEHGSITGEGLVGYLGGNFRPRRIEHPLDAYRARYRFPDGTEEDLVTLQACMNPVSYGGDTYRGFTFAPRTEAVPTPEPERPGPQPAMHPTMVARAIRTAAGAEGHTTVTIGDRTLVFERGVHLNVDEATGAIGMEGTSFRMTIQPKKVKRARAETPRATGTDQA